MQRITNRRIIGTVCAVALCGAAVAAAGARHDLDDARRRDARRRA